MHLRLFVIAVCLLYAKATHAGEQTLDIAGLHVAVWPAEPPTATHVPVLIFSHGFHGCATQSGFLMTAFAEAGYQVFAPNHRDATCDGGAARWLDRPVKPFGKPESWDDSSYHDRANDIAALLEALPADERFNARIDLSRLGLVGHSLGGYTVLGVAGAWPSWKLRGITAVLALSPYTTPFIVSRTLRGLTAPVMYQGGTWDFGITPFLRKEGGAYEQSPEPKYFVEFEHAGHMSWTDLPGTDHDIIVAYSLAFVNRYVKGEAAEPLLTHGGSGVAELRFAPATGDAAATPP